MAGTLISSKNRQNGGFRNSLNGLSSKDFTPEETDSRLSSSRMITIAGSGPSTDLVSKVDVATKKLSVPSDYAMCRFGFQHKSDLPVMLYYKRYDENVGPAYYCDSDRWDQYYKQFVRTKRPPQRVKPSLGLCAVFGVVERWNPDTIGVIGFDKILDADETWEHDAIAELACMRSLVNIKDLRNDTYLCRV